MKNKDLLKNKIIKYYDSLDIDESKKINLDQPAKKNEDPFFVELKNEILNSLNKRNANQKNGNEIKSVKSYKKNKNDISFNNDNIENKTNEVLINNIKKRINKLFMNLNISLYKNSKEKLKKLFISDIKKKFKSDIIDEESFSETIKEICIIIDNKYSTYITDKKNIRKELLNIVLNKILPEVNKFFKDNTKEKLEKMSIIQKQNLVKFVLNSLYKRYLNKDKLNRMIDYDDYQFLKSKIRMFFLHRYNQNISE